MRKFRAGCYLINFCQRSWFNSWSKSDSMPTDIAPYEAFQEVLKDDTAVVTCVKGVDSIVVPSSDPMPADDIAPNNDIAAPKKSFLNVVNALNGNNAPFKAPPTRKSAPTTAKESKGKSIFVGNLAMGVNVEELHLGFKKFGPIKQNGIKTLSDHMKNRCFAFIEFESSSSAQSAIQAASSITIGNRKVHIEEKKTGYTNYGDSKFPPALSLGNGLFTRHNGPVN
ncbi:CUGBP Elav-like family member 6 [Durio zibethinus]|uniref:CUGBP Elav-like family member 6 n=1 Tax=Durio zibethinus TaxID=66656 RepID=A0A6P6AHQ4_DURZI|nr:CUGBP Elav-like family member 6 [Durio zibethinus]